MVSVNVVLLLINIVDCECLSNTLRVASEADLPHGSFISANFLGADLLSACNPWISFFIFASQPDVLRAWHVPVPAFLGSRDESNEVSLSEGSRSHKMNKIRNGQLQSRMDKVRASCCPAAAVKLDPTIHAAQDPEMDDESTRYFNGGINVTSACSSLRPRASRRRN